MNTVRNIVIGMTIATLLFAMFATPAAAVPTPTAFVHPGSGSADVVRDETGTPLLGNGYEVAGPDDLIQVIWDKSKNGITPPDPNDPTKCTNPTDDPVIDVLAIGSGGVTVDAGEFAELIEPVKEIGDRIYLRVWNAPTVEEATYYGDAPVYYDLVDGEEYYDYCPTGNTWGTLTPKPTLSKNVPMKVGWNLISLCFEPSSNVTADVLNSISGNYSEVKEWNAVSKTWADATAMDRGTGYFVYVTTACTWEHTGTKKTASMTIPLEQGLNLVGYPFDKTNSTGDALAGLNYYYAAPFDATAQKYDKTYNPAAPDPFNDFTTINQCEGFWISSKDGGDWNAA